HLMLAILLDPANAAARGLLGLVASGGKWQKPTEIGRQLASDPQRQALIKEYLKRRAAAAIKPDAQWKLALWCEQNGLAEQAEAHYWAVVRLDPKRAAAWRKLGYKKQGAGWGKPEQIASGKTELEKQRAATRHWKPILERCRKGLLSKGPARRARAERALAEITDPRAVAAVWEVLALGDQKLQLAAVQVLGQIDGPAASRTVAALAVFSPYPDVRGRAAETLSRRDPRDFLDSLLSMIHRPFRYKVQPINGPGSAGGVFVDGERFNIKRIYQVSPIVNPRGIPPRIFTADVPFNPLSAANMMMLPPWEASMGNLAPSVSPAALMLGGWGASMFSLPPRGFPGSSAATGQGSRRESIRRYGLTEGNADHPERRNGQHGLSGLLHPGGRHAAGPRNCPVLEPGAVGCRSRPAKPRPGHPDAGIVERGHPPGQRPGAADRQVSDRPGFRH
ncbi:MAG: hypothetical protein ACP5XB_23015, partial [Isosphaeraceae bacterium]